MNEQISTELVRKLRHDFPVKAIDYRDAKVPGFVLRARPSGVHSWRVQLPNKRWLSLGRTDETPLAKAREAAQTARAKYALGEDVTSDGGEEALTLKAFLDDVYGPWMRTNHRKGIEQVTRIRWAFPDFLDMPLAELTALQLERWRTNRTRRHTSNESHKKLSRGTLNRDVAALRAAMRRATQWGHVKDNPLQVVKLLREDSGKVVRYLTPGEEKRLRTALAARDERRRQARDSANLWRTARAYTPWPALGTYTDHLTPLVLLALNTGLRRGELFQLRWADVDLDHRHLTVRGENAKSDNTRHVPLNREALDILLSLDKPTSPADLVFAGADASTPMVETKRSWNGVLKVAEITSFRFHDLRHTFASKLAMASVDLNTIRELLGHSTLTMTLRYAHLAPEHKAAAVARLCDATPSAS